MAMGFQPYMRERAKRRVGKSGTHRQGRGGGGGAGALATHPRSASSRPIREIVSMSF